FLYFALYDIDAGLHIRFRRIRLGLILDTKASPELYFLECLQKAGDVERSLSKDNVGIVAALLFGLVIIVLEMNAEVARTHRQDLLHRIELLAEYCSPNQVARIKAGADERMMVFHGVHDDLS